ncbi:MAG: hypothetical protein IJ461_10620 [Clostridia bacterium]|nr:hypothetical protein [Clostridia bacterium]
MTRAEKTQSMEEAWDRADALANELEFLLWSQTATNNYIATIVNYENHVNDMLTGIEYAWGRIIRELQEVLEAGYEKEAV